MIEFSFKIFVSESARSASRQLVYSPNAVCGEASLRTVGAAPLDVSSVYGLSTFGAASDVRRGKPARSPSRMLVFPHTHTLRR